MITSKTDVKRAFKSFASTMDKSTHILSTDMEFNPGSWRLEFHPKGKVQIVEVVNKNGECRPVTEKVSMKEFVTIAKQMELIKKKESVYE